MEKYYKRKVNLNQQHHQQTINSGCDEGNFSKQLVGNDLENHVVDLGLQKHSRIELNAFVDCMRFYLQQGLTFEDPDEFDHSEDRGHFLELLYFLASHSESVSETALENAFGNNKLVAYEVQKSIANAAAIETIHVVIKDLGDEPFAIIVDLSCDISFEEQMVVVLRYVDKKGCVIERFLGIVHVTENTASSLKFGIEQLLSKHGLTLSRLRGQGIRANGMQNEFNALNSLIMKDNQFAYYVHCFAHQLQRTLVDVAKNHRQIFSLFNVISNLVNVVGASCKSRDTILEIQAQKIKEALGSSEPRRERYSFQEIGLHRTDDTRWDAHYSMLLNFIVMFSSILDVLEFVVENGFDPDERSEADFILDSIQSFDFIFNLHLMKAILGVTNEWSQTLQQKDGFQNISNAMKLVTLSNQRFQNMRDDGWESLLLEVSSFCSKFSVDIPDMNSTYVVKGRSRRCHVEKNTNLHHYRVELFHNVIDMQVQELNNRFSEANTELLLCVACLDPIDSFSAFDKQKLIRLAEFYPVEFSSPQMIMSLDNQLETYILDMRSSDAFSNVKGIDGLGKKLVETKKNTIYPLVYLLIKLALILPFATPTVERAYFGMKMVKELLQIQAGNQWINDCLVTYVEKDVLKCVENEAIIQRFQT